MSSIGCQHSRPIDLRNYYRTAGKSTPLSSRSRRNGVVNEVLKARNRNKSKIRARVEHLFGVLKRLWGFGMVRYRGLTKNATRAFTALALPTFTSAASG